MMTYNWRLYLSNRLSDGIADSVSQFILKALDGQNYRFVAGNYSGWAITQGDYDIYRNYGIYDFSSESDWIDSNKVFYGGARNVTVENSDWWALAIGSGSTSPTKSDYKLENWIPTSKVKFVSSRVTQNKNYLDVDEPPEFIFNYATTYKNVSSDPVTVSEIGLVVGTWNWALTTGGSNDKKVKFLLARNVLDNPITIQPGELYTFTMVFK